MDRKLIAMRYKVHDMCTDLNTVEIYVISIKVIRPLYIHTSAERRREREREREREKEREGGRETEVGERGCTHLDAAAAHSTKARVASTAFS